MPPMSPPWLWPAFSLRSQSLVALAIPGFGDGAAKVVFFSLITLLRPAGSVACNLAAMKAAFSNATRLTLMGSFTMVTQDHRVLQSSSGIIRFMN